MDGRSATQTGGQTPHRQIPNRAGRQRGGLSISRVDVAHLMLTALEQPATVRQAVGVAY
jgi:hypothetical protein